MMITFRTVSVAALLLGGLHCANAITGYDPFNTITNIKTSLTNDAGFATNVSKWAERIKVATDQLNTARELYQTTDTLYQIARDPSYIIESMDSFYEVTRQLDGVFGTDETGAMFDLGRAMRDSERARDAFGRTLDNSAMLGNNDRRRRTTLIGASRVLDRWYNQVDDLTNFQQEQAQDIREKIGEITKKAKSIDTSSDKGKAEAEALMAQVAALQAELALQQQRTLVEQGKVNLVRSEIEDKQKVTDQALADQDEAYGEIAEAKLNLQREVRSSAVSNMTSRYAGIERASVEIK